MPMPLSRHGDAVRWLAALMLLSAVFPASAYRFLYPAVHERITEAALVCAATSREMPTDCALDPEVKESLDLTRLGLGRLTVAEARKAVSWPDDPVREMGTWWNVIGKLKWATRMAVDHCNGLKMGLMDGLRCSSHYGPLQFLHAMEEKLDQPAVDTLDKIMAWSAFTYAAVTDADDHGGLLSQDYCQHWEKHPSAISTVMRPGDGQFPCDGTAKRPWKLSTLFAFTCHVQSVNCWENIHDRRLIRINAIGALLHLVQDSYAKGHTERGDCCAADATREQVQTVECAPVRRFLVYDGQDHTRHGWGDATYTAPAGCAVIHDPVLASATLLWLLKQNAPYPDVEHHLRTRVFVLDNASNSGLGFGK
jgi:hypothetical protein